MVREGITRRVGVAPYGVNLWQESNPMAYRTATLETPYPPHHREYKSPMATTRDTHHGTNASDQQHRVAEHTVCRTVKMN